MLGQLVVRAHFTTFFLFHLLSNLACSCAFYMVFLYYMRKGDHKIHLEPAAAVKESQTFCNVPLFLFFFYRTLGLVEILEPAVSFKRIRD